MRGIVAHGRDTHREDFNGREVVCREERGWRGDWTDGGVGERWDYLGEDEDLECCLEDIDCVAKVVVMVRWLVT